MGYLLHLKQTKELFFSLLLLSCVVKRMWECVCLHILNCSMNAGGCLSAVQVVYVFVQEQKESMNL